MSVHQTIDEGLGRVVLDHPPLNILTRELLRELREALTDLGSEPEIRVLLMSAAGRHFSAGADVAEHLPPDFEALIPEFIDTIEAIVSFPVPVVAAVQGRCLGGGFEVAMAADMIVAAEGASFGQPEIVLGVLPPVACAILPRLCAWGVAARIVYTGRPLSAAEAERAGIVLQVVPDDQIEATGTELARSMTGHSAAALRAGKRMMEAAGIRDALRRAGELYVNELMETRDATEGLRAFLDKRQPEWSHR